MLKRLLCWLVGHDLRVMRQLGLHTQKVRCSCCRTEYVINRSTDTIARWGRITRRLLHQRIAVTSSPSPQVLLVVAADAISKEYSVSFDMAVEWLKAAAPKWPKPVQPRQEQ